jgi:predicted transcriptional regulator of viral defense system
MASNPSEKVLQLIREAGVLRPRALDKHRIPRIYLLRLYRAGRIERLGRGLYRLAEVQVTGRENLAEACARVPRGVVCLLSALAFHEFTTQMPSQIWMAIPVKSWTPRANDLPLRFVRFSDASICSNVQRHTVNGAEVRVFSPAKTVADCFKFRNKIGKDVALEALRDGWRSRLFTMDELWETARVCRVQKVMRPYLEGLVG